MQSPFMAPRHRHTIRSAIVACVAALFLSGCGAPPSTDSPPEAVALAAVEPNVALPGTTVTLRGSGFVDDLALRVGGQSVAGSLLGPDALSFVVPDTSGYPVIELGEVSGERLLFVGAEYAGDATTAGVQAALDALPPGIALRLPASTITGEYLVVAERALYGSGSAANGTRLELQGTAWLVVGADLADLHLRASQVIVRDVPPADPSTPFDSLALAHATREGAAGAGSSRVSDVTIELTDEPTTFRRTVEAIAGFASVTFEDVRIDGFSVALYVDAFVARRLSVAGRRFSVYALTTLDVTDADVDVSGRVDLTAEEPGRVALTRVSIDADLDVTLDAGDRDPDVVVEVSDLRARSAQWVSIRPSAAARVRGLDVAGAVVEIESGSRDLGLETATVYADDTVRLLADNGALTLTDVDVTLGPDAADALHGLNPTSLEVRGRLGVDVRGGAWNAGPTARVGSEIGALTVLDLDIEADEWIAFVGTSGVALERATIAARSNVLVAADGPIDVDEPSITTGAFDLDAAAGGFTLRRGTVSAVGGVVLSSQGGAGVIEDMALVVRSQDGIRVASDVRLEIRRTRFAFSVPMVFDAPPGELVLEDLTGADGAETPGQP